MVNLDPRAETKVSTETVSGVITDRALELLGLLNNAIGAEGQLGAQEAEIIFNDGTENRTETVSSHLVGPSAHEGQWKEDERIFFQATHHRVDSIKGELEGNFNNLKDQLVGSISGLFETLASKENDSTGGKSINELEQDIQNATTTEELIRAQEALDAKVTQLLTSEEALEQMVLAFFQNAQLNISRINEEIFDKLHDFDEDYADGASDIENEKFYFRRGYDMPGDDPDVEKPAFILNTIDEVFDMYINDQRLLHEDRFGAGTYTQSMAEQFVKNEVEAKFVNGDLKLSDDIIALIIADNNLTEEELLNVTDMKEFIDLISFNKLIEYTGIANRQEAINSLYKDHLQISTPKYYQDKRSVYDILKGKSEDLLNSSTKDRIFSSIHSQMGNIAQGVTDLYRNGYDKVANSDLQIAIRNYPFAAIEYLETQRADQTGVFAELLDKQIEALQTRQIVLMKNRVEDLVKERREIQSSENVDQARIDEINATISKMGAIEAQLRGYNANQNADTKAKLLEIFPDLEEVSEAFAAGNLEFSTFTRAMDSQTKFNKANKMVFAMESQESGKKNAEYYTKKRPTPQADGTIPEDTMPIPPLLSPSPLAAVIARIGDELVNKSQALVTGTQIPTTTWMENNTKTLLDINAGLGQLGADNAGEAFYNRLKDSFKNIIKEFFSFSSPLKNKQDQVKGQVEEIMDRQMELTALTQGDVDLSTRTLSANLNNIEKALGSNVKSGSNFLNRAGLEQAKDYLNQQINTLDGVDYDREITNRLNQIEILNQKERDGEITDEERQLRSQLQAEVRDLRRDENNLEKAQELLYGTGGSRTNPEEGSVLDIFRDFDGAVNQYIADNGGLNNGQTRADFLNTREGVLSDEFKTTVQEYSDSLTNFGADSDGDGEEDLITAFRDSLDKPARDIDGDGIVDVGLDLDGNGENDFADINNMINSLDNLSDDIQSTFGGKEAQAGGIANQSIRRMLLLMFVFSILEAGEWQYRKDEANVDRYAIY